jgi:predicted ATPase
VLVVRGEEGVGKTALLGHLLGSASGCRTSRVAGIESEMGPAFAGLRQVCAPFLDRLDRLASPQREALRTMFGFRPGEVPDLLFVGLAALSLLSDAAGERPLVCVVDDAQWLDQPSAQALAFMSRRLQAESIAMVFAVRDSGYEHEFAGLKELAVSGLSHDDAATLLASVVSGPIDKRLRDRVIAEARGNPRALLNFHLGLAPAEFGIPETTPLSALRQGTL